MENNANKVRNLRRKRKRLIIKLNRKQNKAQDLIQKLEKNNNSTEFSETLQSQKTDCNLKEKLSPIFEQLFRVCEEYINQTQINKTNT